MTLSFPSLQFQGVLRPSQRAAIEIAKRQLDAGHERLHIVAPPGSGKTVLGLYLWSECLRVPALVLSPNSAIQAQWAARADLFGKPGVAAEWVSTDPEAPGLFTSLTYQCVTMPQRGTSDVDEQAVLLWQGRLIEKGQAVDHEEAATWIADLRRHNPDYFEDRLSGYRKELRDEAAIGGDAMRTLHASSLATLERLKQRGIGLIILDECHHLLCHWGRVLADVRAYFDHPIVLGLTATPPDRRGQRPEDLLRYDEFFGPINYEVPVPAVVKDGFLAPYQDLVQFVRPTADELAFIANADEQLQQLVDELCRESPTRGVSEGGRQATPTRSASEDEHANASESSSPPDASPSLAHASGWCAESLPAWISRVLGERRLPVGMASDWASFVKRDEIFANAARWFLLSRRLPLPAGVPLPPKRVSTETAGPEMSLLAPVLDRYIRHRLRTSSDPADHVLAERAIARLRMLGVQVTETGTQACASPVGRVLMHSRSKIVALISILHAERRVLGERLRAVVVTDFERTSAVSAEVGHLLDEEAGGAIAAFRMLLGDRETDELNPVLVTGSSVLVDDDLAPRFGEAATAWLKGKGLDVAITFADEADVRHESPDAVRRGSPDPAETPGGQVSSVFGRPAAGEVARPGDRPQRSAFKVMIGTGADWSPRVYVALITELFQRGLTRCLVGTRGLLGEGWDATKVNVLVDLTSVTTSTSVNQLRGRSFRLDPDDPEKLSDNWDVICVAPECTKGLDDYARFIDKHNTLFGLTDDGAVEKGVGHVHAAFTEIKPEGIEDSMAVLNAEMLARPQRRAEFRKLWRIGEPFHPVPIHAVETSGGGGGGGFPPFPGAKSPWSGESLTSTIGEAVLAALRDANLIERGAEVLHVGTRSGGYVRAFLKDADPAASTLFSEALHEALGPLDNPRYVIPRYVDLIDDTWLARILPRLIGQYFRRSRRTMQMLHAVPSVFGRNKELTLIYQRHWNARVSPGEAVFAQRGEGEALLEQALQSGTVPQTSPHRKEIFL